MKARYCLPIILAVLALPSVLPAQTSDSGMWVVAQVQTQEAQQAGQELLVTLNLADVPVKTAIEQLFAGSGRKFILEAGATGTVTIKFDRVPFSTALHTLANIAHLAIREQNGIIILSPDQLNMQIPMPQPGVSVTTPGGKPGIPMMQQSSPGIVNIRPASAARGERTFDVVLDQANLLEAVKQLLDMAGYQYVFNTGSVSHPMLMPRITAKMRNASLDDILSILAKSTPLLVGRQGNTYMLGLRSEPYPVYNNYNQGKGGTAPVAPGLPCASCGRPLSPDWGYCPYCGLQTNPPVNKGTK